MSVKSSISLTEQQDAFARSLVDTGRYSSVSSVIQQGLDLLRQKETESAETEAMKELIHRRLSGASMSEEAMAGAVDDMIARKQRALRVES